MLSPAAALAGTVYDVLLADPPWEYDQRMGRGVAEDHYSVMDQAAIEGLELPALSQEAVLYLWATSPLLPEALRVLEAWGFKYKSSLCWVKNNVGVGFWSRGRHELVLIGAKPDAKPPEAAVRPDSVFVSPRREHSAKPDLLYSIIEQCFPDATKAELFARTTRHGWDSWGNEVQEAATQLDLTRPA